MMSLEVPLLENLERERLARHGDKEGCDRFQVGQSPGCFGGIEVRGIARLPVRVRSLLQYKLVADE
jgi:hypothetical protein